MRFTACLLLAVPTSAAPSWQEGVCMNSHCGCGPNYKAKWCGPKSTSGKYCSRNEMACKGCKGTWCGSTDAAPPTVRAVEHVCMNADCGCGPKYHKGWCGPQHTNGKWCSASEDRCRNDCRGGVWCGAAAAPEDKDHHAAHKELKKEKFKLDAEKALLDKTKVHLDAEKKIWQDGRKQLDKEKKIWQKGKKELDRELKGLKKDKKKFIKQKVWKEERPQWREDKKEYNQDLKEWKKDRKDWYDDHKEWKGEKKEWVESNKDFQKNKKEWNKDMKELRKDLSDFVKDVKADQKELNKDLRKANKEINKHNKDKKILKKKGLWKEEKEEWQDARKELLSDKKELKQDIAEWKDIHGPLMNKKKFWKDVSGDPFVVDQSGKKVQFFLRQDQEELLLRCGAMQMYGRTMGTDIVGDHQQWFDRMRFVIGNQEQLLVGVNKAAAQVGLEQDGIDVLAPNASHKHDSSVGQVVQKPLNILQVMVEGAKMSMTGAVATDSALVAIWSGSTGETVQFSDGNTVIQVKSAIAQKFTEKNEQKMYTHLDLRFMEVKTSECSAGLLAEIWGFAPMSEKTAAMLQPPQ